MLDYSYWQPASANIHVPSYSPAGKLANLGTMAPPVALVKLLALPGECPGGDGARAGRGSGYMPDAPM